MADQEPYLRVHIVPLGEHLPSVVEPLVRRRADRVYLLGDPSSHMLDLRSEVKAKLTEEYPLIEPRDVTVNLLDFSALQTEYAKIVKEERKKRARLFVNVSSGNEFTAMVGLLSSLFWDTEAYSVIPMAPLGGTKGVTVVAPLPVVSFDVLPRGSARTLHLLRTSARSLPKEELIGILTKEGLLPEIGRISKSGVYKRLESLLEPLISRRFIDVKGERRGARISVTDQGISAAKLILPLLE